MACITDNATSTHELHEGEKMELTSLLPFSQVFIIGPYLQQVKLRHLKKEGEKWFGILKISA